jgi:hypothetical protein
MLWHMVVLLACQYKVILTIYIKKYEQLVCIAVVGFIM